MKSHELARILLDHPNVELICQKDSEGNGYSPLAGVDFDVIYIAENSYSGDCYSTEWSAEDAGLEEKEWISLKQAHINMHAVLYPTN